MSCFLISVVSLTCALPSSTQLAGGQAVENGVSVILIFAVDGMFLGGSIEPIFPCFFLVVGSFACPGGSVAV